MGHSLVDGAFCGETKESRLLEALQTGERHESRAASPRGYSARRYSRIPCSGCTTNIATGSERMPVHATAGKIELKWSEKRSS